MLRAPVQPLMFKLKLPIPTSTSHVGSIHPASVVHARGTHSTAAKHVDPNHSASVVHVGGARPTSTSHVGPSLSASVSHAEGSLSASTSHAGGSLSASVVHAEDNPSATVGHVDTVEKTNHSKHKHKFPCKLCEGDHLTYKCPSIAEVRRVWFHGHPVF